MRRPISIQASQWEEHLEKFDAVGNLKKLRHRDPTGLLEGEFVYDRFNHLTLESPFAHQYAYDSIGNCLKKDRKEQTINSLNQLKNEEKYHYDLNGNLTNEPSVEYVYDAFKSTDQL